MSEKLCEFPSLNLSFSEQRPCTEESAGHWWNTITYRENSLEDRGEMTPEIKAEIQQARAFIKKRFPDIEAKMKARDDQVKQVVKEHGKLP